jgi:hypothetical protein
MIRVILYLAAIAASAIAEAQVTENRNVADFTEIHVSSGVRVIYTQSNTKSVVVESDSQEKIDRIGTEVKNGKLRVVVKPKKGKTNFNVLKVHVSAPDVTSFVADSGAHIEFENELQSKSALKFKLDSGSRVSAKVVSSSMDLDVESGSHFTAELEVTKISAEVDSGSRVTLSGTGDNLNLKVDSGSHFTGKDLTVKSTVISADSASHISITVTESIEAEANSVSIINYYGNPKHTDVRTKSLGQVNKK